MKPRQKRELAEYLRESYRVGVRWAVGAVLLSPSGYYYKAHPRDGRALRKRIKEIAETRVRYGMWRTRCAETDQGRQRQRVHLEALDQWACENDVVLDFSVPGKPADNLFIESFNGSVLANILSGEIIATHV